MKMNGKVSLMQRPFVYTYYIKQAFGKGCQNIELGEENGDNSIV